MEAIGILESNSIAKGIEAADAILKAADTSLLFSKPVCPGKYTTLFYGDVAAVQASLEAGERVTGEVHYFKILYRSDSVVIPRVHPQVIQAINLSTTPEGVNAVGVMEFYSITAAVYAADAAVKAADVTLIDVRLGIGIGGKSFAVLTGDVAAVEEAVKCGMAAGTEKGLALSSVVIPSPREEIFAALL